MIVFKKGDSFEYKTSIKSIDVQYLKQVEEELQELDLLSEVQKNIKLLVIKKDNILNIDKLVNIMNTLVCYNEGISSSRIENMIQTELANSEVDIKIQNYIDQTYKLNKLINNENKITLEDISNFHNAIEPDKYQGYRYDNNITQVIGEHKAPDGQELKQSLLEWFDIYLGHNGYEEVNYLVRFAYQHLYLETLHPFDDGNGRTGRMLNLLFFKNQELDYLSSILIETSTNIFNNVQVYQQLLAKARITIKFKPDLYESQINESIQKDVSFCSFMLSRLNEKVLWMIDNIEALAKEIEDIKVKCSKNKILKKYGEVLFEFFSHNIKFDNKRLVEKTGLNIRTINKIIDELKGLDLVVDSSSSKKYKNKSIMLFKPFLKYVDIKQ